MSAWHRLFPAADLPPGRSRFLSINAVELAVFRLIETGELLITHNSCPHAGGNLSAGEVKNGVVTCPWHQWEFDLRTGACIHNTQVRARVYPARVVEGWVEVDLQT